MKTLHIIGCICLCLFCIACKSGLSSTMIPDDEPLFQLNFQFNRSVRSDSINGLSLNNFNKNLVEIDSVNSVVSLPQEVEFGPTISFVAKENFYRIITGVQAMGEGAGIIVSVPEIGYYESQEISNVNDDRQDLMLMENLNFVKGKEVKIYLYNSGQGEVQFDNFNCVIFDRLHLESFEGIPKLKIELDSASQSKLNRFKNKAIRQSYISKEEKKYVAAVVNDVEMKLRIKGDHIDHIKGGKVSYRIKDSKGNYSVHHPKSRGFLKEWLWHKVLIRESILTTDYSFVEVIIDNNTRGLFAKERHFDTLFGLNQNKKGLVLKFNEDGLWDFQNFKEAKKIWQYYYVFDVAPITTFKFSKNTSGIRKKWFLDGAETVSNLRKGILDSSKVDLANFAKFFALNDLFLTNHSLSWNNIRFFYNSNTEKIEPVGFDGFEHYTNIHKWKNTELMGLIDEKHDTIYHSSIYLWAQFFNHPGFTEMYLKNLITYSSTEFLDEIKQNNWSEWSRLEKELSKEFSSFKYSLDELKERQTQIRTLLKDRNDFADEKRQFKFYSMFQWGSLHPNEVPKFDKTTWVKSLGLESYVVGSKTKYRNLHPSSIKVVKAILEDGTHMKLNETLKAYNPHSVNKFISLNKKVAYFVVIIEGKLAEIPVRTKFYENYLD